MRAGGQDYFLLQDGSGNTVALTDGAGKLVETYEYGDFALPRIRDAAGNPSPSSKLGNIYLYGGLEHDGATGLYRSTDSGVHFDPRSGKNLNARYKLQSGFIYATAPSAARNVLLGHDIVPKVSDFGMARRGASTRDPDGLVFNVINPRAARSGDPLKEEAHFREVTGLDVYIDCVEVQEGGKNDGAHKRPGTARFSHICLKRGTTKSKAFFGWIAGAVNREVKRMGGKIALCRRDGAPVIEWTFEKGWPAKWTGPDLDASKNEVAIETLEIAHAGMLPAVGTTPLFSLHRRQRLLDGSTVSASKNEIAIETIEIAHHGFEAGRVGSPPLHGPPELPASTYRMSDNGWGNCFNCHPFGLERPAGGDAEFYEKLTNMQKSKHDAAMAAIQNTR
jgi:phage tail-like protein